MAKGSKFPFDLDLSTLDTGSITNILNDIDQHMPFMENERDRIQLVQVKEFFEEELKLVNRLHWKYLLYMYSAPNMGSDVQSRHLPPEVNVTQIDL